MKSKEPGRFISEKIRSAKKVLMLFLDGVGVGNKNPDKNPFFKTDFPALKFILNERMPHINKHSIRDNYVFYKNINATLGIAGLPQSGTGQTALLCGMNAARFIGKHFGPYPYSTLVDVLANKNIFLQVEISGKKPFYVNAYPPKYFDYIKNRKSHRTATTLAWTLSGNSLNDFRKLRKSEALSSDITGERWNNLGFPKIDEINPEEAGKRLVSFFKNYDFVFFEYFYTDHAGHHQSMEKATEELKKIDSLIAGILSSFNKNEMTLIITSDHGNIEDLSVRTHTRNPVPLIVYGEMAKRINSGIKNISQITPEIIKFFNE